MPQALTLGFEGQVSDTEHHDGVLGDRRVVADLRPVVPVAVACDHRGGHAGEETAGRRLRRIEVGVGIEPDDAAIPVLEPPEHAEAGIARSRKDEGKLPCTVRLPYQSGDLFVHLSRRARRVSKERGKISTPARHADTVRRDQLVGAGFDDPSRSLARAVTVIAGVRGNFDQADVYLNFPLNGRARILQPRSVRGLR